MIEECTEKSVEQYVLLLSEETTHIPLCGRYSISKPSKFNVYQTPLIGHVKKEVRSYTPHLTVANLTIRSDTTIAHVQ